jgi:hypothetical protein
MTSISGSGYRIDLSQTKALDISSASVRKLTDEEKAKFEKIREMLYAKPANLDELKDHVSQKPYAQVVVNGKVVATLYNSGAAETSNATYARVKNLSSMGEEEKSTGPELAQKRAEEIAKALGGSVVKSDTAVTQSQYLSTPAFQVKYEIDYAAMERDRAAVTGQVSTPKTTLDAQSLASEDSTGKSVVDEFLDFTGKSWQDKVRTMILKSMGLKEEDLAAMSPEDREKIEARIKEKIKEEVEKKTGVAVSGTVAAA